MKRLILFLVVICLAYAVSVGQAAFQKPKSGVAGDVVINRTAVDQLSGEQISWEVISGGATDGTSTNYQMMGTVGQSSVGYGSSANYGLMHGYWQIFAGGGGGSCCQERGDINDDGTGPDIADLVGLVNFMFGGEPYPGCEDAGVKSEADINGDGIGPDISDLVALVNYMFNGCQECLVSCP